MLGIPRITCYSRFSDGIKERDNQRGIRPCLVAFPKCHLLRRMK